MSSSPRAVAVAYDVIADDYDRLVAEDEWMRRVLWAHYRTVFAPGSRLLEIGCGTGLDTIFLAEQGHEIVALDVSPRMIEQLRTKLHHYPARHRVELRVQDAAELSGAPGEEFDGLVAAFATVNTIDDLPRFATEAARLLRPGGRMILHLLAPAGGWERWKAIRQDGWKTGRALHRRRQRTLEIGGRKVCHRVLPPDEARRLFAAGFRRRRAYGLGFLWPRDMSRRIRPAVARRLGRAEARLGALPPFLGWGRFFVLDLERRP